MLVRFFRYNYQLEILLILLVGGVLWAWGFNTALPATTTPQDVAPLSGFLNTIRPQWLNAALALLLVIVEAFMISSLTGRFKILGITNLLPSLVYIILVSYNQNLMALTPALLSNFFIIILLYHLFEIYNQREPYLLLFNASFLIGIAALLMPQNIFLILLIWITFVIYRSYTPREWLISLSGIVIVAAFVATIYYLNDSFQSLLTSYGHYFRNMKTGVPDVSAEFLPFLALIAFYTLITVPRMIIKLDDNIIKTRKRLNVVIFHALIALVLVFVNPRFWEYYIYMLFIPLSITISRLIINIKKERNKDWVLILLLLTVLMERIL